ncbi:MAG: response regulator [Candidatus Thermoplasmatota archaeon]|nr:response regulator [Candidatus Thermoplasmatota archaeon]
MKKKIMVVDDEPDVTYTIELNLKMFDKDYEITRVSSGEQCLELLKNGESPDLILLDIMMPGMSGEETYEKIRENPSWKGIPVVFLTAKVDEFSGEHTTHLGEEYIEKPYDPTELRDRLQKILTKSRA